MRKKIIVLLGFLLVSCLAFSLNISQTGNTVDVSWSASRDGQAPAISSQILALPARTVAITVNRMEANIFNAAGDLIGQERALDNSRVYVGDSFVMREMHGFAINAIIEKTLDNGNISRITALDYSVSATASIDLPTSVSSAFVKQYAYLADNYETSYLRNLPVKQPKILIISHNDFILSSYLSLLVDWKKQLGYDIEVVYKSDLGNSVLDIKAALLQKWNNGDKFDYLILVGDVAGNFAIPTAYYQFGDETDGSDNIYATLEGDDYIHDCIVGRFSVDTGSEFGIITKKTINYEKSPELSSGWLDRGLVVAGNYASGGADVQPITPVWMSRWVYRELMDAGYTHVDTVFYNGSTDPNPGIGEGAPYILSAINSGCGIINYRGWGAAEGWHKPEFHTDDFSGLTNNKYPIMFSVVCGTGNFSNPTVDPVFGEAWMVQGTYNAPRGGVAFFGPTDLHTNTHLNNALSAGIIQSILHHDVRSFGEACSFGKLEMYRQYPLEREGQGDVFKYFSVFNILSDPTLNMWIRSPSALNVTAPTAFTGDANYFEITADASYFTATVSQDTQTYTVIKGENGRAIIPLNPDGGDVLLTVSAPKKVPFQRTISYTRPSGVTLVNDPLATVAITSGQTQTVSLSVKNFGTNPVSNLTGTLACSNPNVQIANSQVNFNTVNAGATVSASSEIAVGENVENNTPLEFTLTFNNNTVAKFTGLVMGMYFFPAAWDTTPFIANQSVPLNITLKNMTAISHNNVTATIRPLTDAVTVSNPTVNLGNIPGGGDVNALFNVIGQSSVYKGRNVGFEIDLTDDENRTYTATLYRSFGTQQTTDPTGPDAYGYYMYDSNDVGYDEHPTYNWLETDPNISGSLPGTIIPMYDDDRKSVPLPFAFRFYGEAYNQVTICSNGWISFIPTLERNFRNWEMPAPMSPKTLIAGYWDDLTGLKYMVDSVEVEDMIRITTYHDQANHRFIMQWNDAYNHDGDRSLEKFQIILYDPAFNSTQSGDGEAIIQYHTIDNSGVTNNYSTIGLQNYDRSIGLTYTYADIYYAGASVLADGLAIKITTDEPDTYTPADNDTPQMAKAVLSNYPNPFNPTTTIKFSLTTKEKAKLEIYNIKGQKVTELANDVYDSGEHQLTWHGKDQTGKAVASGIYFIKLSTPTKKVTAKALLLK